MIRMRFVMGLCLVLPFLAQAGPIETLLSDYQQMGGSDFSAAQGETRWKQVNRHPKNGKERSCSDCHTSDLTQVGKHAKTGKKIKPIAPSANPKRLTDEAKIEKWFKRNCKWTLGRECTPQEKGDFLIYMQQQ